MMINYKPYLDTSDIANILEVNIQVAQRYMRELKEMTFIEEDELGNKVTVKWKDSQEFKWLGRKGLIKQSLFVKRFKETEKCFIKNNKKSTSL